MRVDGLVHRGECTLESIWKRRKSKLPQTVVVCYVLKKKKKERPRLFLRYIVQDWKWKSWKRKVRSCFVWNLATGVVETGLLVLLQQLPRGCAETLGLLGQVLLAGRYKRKDQRREGTTESYEEKQKGMEGMEVKRKKGWHNNGERERGRREETVTASRLRGIRKLRRFHTRGGKKMLSIRFVCWVHVVTWKVHDTGALAQGICTRPHGANPQRNLPSYMSLGINTSFIRPDNPTQCIHGSGNVIHENWNEFLLFNACRPSPITTLSHFFCFVWFFSYTASSIFGQSQIINADRSWNTLEYCSKT